MCAELMLRVVPNDVLRLSVEQGQDVCEFRIGREVSTVVPIFDIIIIRLSPLSVKYPPLRFADLLLPSKHDYRYATLVKKRTQGGSSGSSVDQ